MDFLIYCEAALSRSPNIDAHDQSFFTLDKAVFTSSTPVSVSNSVNDLLTLVQHNTITQVC